MASLEKVIAVFETSDSCHECRYFQWGPGGPDPCGCVVIDGAEGTDFDDCPAMEE